LNRSSSFSGFEVIVHNALLCRYIRNYVLMHAQRSYTTLKTKVILSRVVSR